MLHEFLSANRAELIARCRAKVAERPAREAPTAELEYGISLFLDQIIKTLRIEQGDTPLESRRVSGVAGGAFPTASEIGEGAGRHGNELLRHGFTIEQVVHDYGDLCQAIMEVASETDTPISPDEYKTFNRCLDNAIAEAVTEFSYQRDSQVANQQSQNMNERLGFLAHELRNLLSTAMVAISIIKTGDVGLSGATGAVLDRSLIGLRNLIDRSLAEVRMGAELTVQHQLFSLAEFIAEVKLSADMEATLRGSTLTVTEVAPMLALDADRDLLSSALGNLLQNAFKFTRPGMGVTLSAYALAERILIDVEDGGQGLPPDFIAQMFAPFTQAVQDRSGLGLGLSIARRGVEANAGTLRVRNKPLQTGAIFTIDLPRFAVPAPTAATQ